MTDNINGTNVLAVVDKRHMEAGHLKKIDPIPSITEREVMQKGNEVLIVRIPVDRNKHLVNIIDRLIRLNRRAICLDSIMNHLNTLEND